MCSARALTARSVLHRTTLEGTRPIDPPAESALPPFAYIWGANPLGGDAADGVTDGLWMGSDHFGVGFRFNQSLPMRN